MAVISSELIKSTLAVASRKVTYAATYRVKTDIRDQSPLTVFFEAQAAAPHPLPAYFSTYNLQGSTDANAFAQDYTHSIKDEKNASHHQFSVKWSPIEGDPANDQTSQSNPLLRPIERWAEVETIMVPAEAGWNDEALTGISRSVDTYGPIQDAAGQEPSSPVMVPKQIIVIVSEKTFATLDEILSAEINYHNAINTDTVFGAPAGEALYRGAGISRRQYSGGVSYYTAQRRVAFQGGGWSFAMVNRGWKYMGDDPKNPGTTVALEATIKDKDGNDVSAASPINLELDGTRTADGDMGTIINWRTSKKLAFAGLGL